VFMVTRSRDKQSLCQKHSLFFPRIRRLETALQYNCATMCHGTVSNVAGDSEQSCHAGQVKSPIPQTFDVR
jgi:hypothetical protein